MRQERAQRYTDLLASVKGLKTPHVAAGREHVWHLYVIEHSKRDELAQHLSSEGIPTVVNYPVALPFLPAYSRFNHVPGDFPNAYASQSRILSIPIYPELSDVQLDKVVESISDFCVKN